MSALAARRTRAAVLHGAGPGIRSAAILAASFLLIAAASPGRAQAPADESEGGQLRQLREQIIEVRERVGKREREEREIFDRLEAIDRKIDQLASDVVEARRSAEAAWQALAETLEDESMAAAQIEETREAMSRRVVGLYKTGVVGPLRVLFASGSLPELLRRASVLRKLLEHDADLITRYRGEQAALEAARGEARKRARLRDEAAGHLEGRTLALRAEHAAKSELLALVRNDRTMERAMLVELERAARALEEKLVALGESRGEAAAGLDAADFEAQKGKLPSPVRADIAVAFGLRIDAEFRTETFKKGVEFGVALGDSVRAVAFGEVRYAGWFRGYGKIVILDHGNQYFTVSGHLADLYVDVGQTVDRGDTLATAGATGSLSGPSFYFEVRHGGEPLDPSQWLRSAGRSKGRTR